jgi:hypothetical protein
LAQHKSFCVCFEWSDFKLILLGGQMVDLIVKKRQLLQDDDTTAQCHVGARWGFWKSPAMFFYLRINTFLNIATKLSSELERAGAEAL